VASELIFNIIDKDNSNSIDFEEFKKFFVNQGIQFHLKELHTMFEDMDEDKSGTIDMEEFNKKFK